MKRYGVNFAVVFVLFVITVILVACASGGRIESKTDSKEDIVWPPGESAPRIEYMGSISKPEDINISQGLIGILKAVAIGEEDNSMVLPMAITTNKMNQLFVADPGKKGIHRFDTKRGKYKFLKRKGDKDFKTPISMDSDKNGNIYITDSELAKVFIVNLDDDFAIPLSLAEDFVRPTGIAVDKRTGWIYVVDTGAHAIYVFKSDASLVKKFSHRGTGEGEFNYPTYLWQRHDGSLLVTDSLNFRIQVFNRYGIFENQFGNPGNGTGDLARPKGVAVDSHGHIYITDSLFHNVQVFDESGKFLLTFGEQGTGSGQFWLPVGITITEDDTIYIADSYNKRIQIFQYVGMEK
jgi:outer membrane protein assembly factor BamB